MQDFWLGFKQFFYGLEFWLFLMRYEAHTEFHLAYRKGQFFKILSFPIY